MPAARPPVATQCPQNLRPAKLMRHCNAEPFRVFDADFTICDLPDGWRAVACTSASSPSATMAGFCADEMTVDRWKDVLRLTHDSICRTGDLRLHKYSPSGQVAELAINWPGRGELAVVCKHGRVDSFTQRIGSYFKGPKEWREFWLGHQLRHLGLPTPLPLVCTWRRAGMFHLQGRLVTEFIADALPLDRAIRKLDAGRSRFRRSTELDTLTRRMAQVLSTLGDHGLYHRDLKVSNVLVSACETDPQPWLIDLDGVAREPQPHGPRFSNTLARLAASSTESTDLTMTQYLRGLNHIIAARRQPATDWKSVWRETQRTVVRMGKHQQRRRETADLT